MEELCQIRRISVLAHTHTASHTCDPKITLAASSLGRCSSCPHAVPVVTSTRSPPLEDPDCPPPALHHPAPSLSWQAQTPDATCGRYFICCIWFLSRFDKPLCWQPQKCLWACHMVKTPNWLSELPTMPWLTGEKGEIVLFVHELITSHVSGQWVLT